LSYGALFFVCFVITDTVRVYLRKQFPTLLPIHWFTALEYAKLWLGAHYCEFCEFFPPTKKKEKRGAKVAYPPTSIPIHLDAQQQPGPWSNSDGNSDHCCHHRQHYHLSFVMAEAAMASRRQLMTVHSRHKVTMRLNNAE